jgi:predicted transcriptional regulator
MRSLNLTELAERHYTVTEIAKMWNLSTDAVRRLFEKEPGVLVLGHSQGRVHKRRYATLRIPESVAERVHRRNSLLSNA